MLLGECFTFGLAPGCYCSNDNVWMADCRKNEGHWNNLRSSKNAKSDGRCILGNRLGVVSLELADVSNARMRERAKKGNDLIISLEKCEERHDDK